jgi:hypothetical protein
LVDERLTRSSCVWCLFLFVDAQPGNLMFTQTQAFTSDLDQSVLKETRFVIDLSRQPLAATQANPR